MTRDEMRAGVEEKARLSEAFADRYRGIPGMREEVEAVEAEAAALRALLAREQAQQEALTELAALVRGECPSLLNEDSGGDARLDLKIAALLTPAVAPEDAS